VGQGGAEADMAEADCEPGENCGEPGEGEQPVEIGGLGGGGEDCGVGDETDGAGEEDGDKGAAFAVDAGGLVSYGVERRKVGGSY